ncbi:MAG: hypothetical protein PHY59_05620 [Methanobacterium sp.]|nr:hypothetical protein [Methanobacterium sp.]
MVQDPLNELFKDIKDPDNRAKMFLLFAGAMIMSTILIVFGTIIFILRLLHIF